VILDDALAFSDDHRIESMLTSNAAGEEVQIIVLTCEGACSPASGLRVGNPQGCMTFRPGNSLASRQQLLRISYQDSTAQYPLNGLERLIALFSRHSSRPRFSACGRFTQSDRSLPLRAIAGRARPHVVWSAENEIRAFHGRCGACSTDHSDYQRPRSKGAGIRQSHTF